ncbi:MAG TPA: PPC domain-containing protein [Anaerolineae bacterium]|nr:PPC domain-containing protein [Anaerolineae bacterium]
MPDHPWRTLVLGTSTPTATFPPTPTFGSPRTATPTLTATPAEGMDTFEPDDTIALATTIQTDGIPQSHTLDPAGDRDYLSFEVEAGMQYTVETGNLGPACDTVLILYDEDGTELTDDDDGGEQELASRLSWTARDDGMLFAEMRSFDEEAEQGNTEYDVWVSKSEPTPVDEDEYEPDDTLEQANEILLGIPQTHGLHHPADRDWVFFEAVEGKTYVIETSDLRGGMDTIIFLHDEEGEKLAENDDGGSESQASRITWNAGSSGTLYVAIQDYYGYEVTLETGYTISVVEGVTYKADAYEPDDSQDQAVAIEVGSYQTHDLHDTGDQDWMCFEATVGTNYVIETFNLGDNIDTYLALYDANGRQLAEDDDSGSEELATLLRWAARETGTVCLLTRDLGDSAAGPGTEYSVAVLEEGAKLLFPDAYEPDDTMASATTMELGQVQSRNVHVEADHDWLSFQAEEGLTYVVETYHLGDGIDTVIFLYNENGQELAQDDDDGGEPRASRITWTAETAGTFHVLVRDYKDDRANRDMTYDISVYESGEGPDRTTSSAYLADGSYHIVAADPSELVVGVSQRLSLAEFSLEVDAQQVSGDDDNEYGLVCGYQDDDNYYELAISGDGYVGFFAKQRGRWEQISPFSWTETINQGSAINRLRLEVAEGMFSLYVNDQLALQELDQRFGEGLIGFGCGSFTEPMLHCSFDNLSVWDRAGTLIWEDSFDDNSGEWYQSPVR